MALNYIALVLLIVIIALVVYGLIAVWGIPYEIAKNRDHPHQDAIGAATWVSLFTLGVLWPFLWIWPWPTDPIGVGASRKAPLSQPLPLPRYPGQTLKTASRPSNAH